MDKYRTKLHMNYIKTLEQCTYCRKTLTRTTVIHVIPTRKQTGYCSRKCIIRDTSVNFLFAGIFLFISGGIINILFQSQPQLFIFVFLVFVSPLIVVFGIFLILYALFGLTLRINHPRNFRQYR